MASKWYVAVAALTDSPCSFPLAHPSSPTPHQLFFFLVPLTGRLFASSGTDERVRLWSADTTGTWRCVMNLQGPQKGTIRSGQSASGLRAPPHPVRLSAHFPHDPRTIFSAIRKGCADVRAHTVSFALTVAWSADGQRLATACFDGTSCVWERQGQGGRTCFLSTVQPTRNRAEYL